MRQAPLPCGNCHFANGAAARQPGGDSIAALAGWALSSTIARPVRRMTDVMRELANGNFSSRLPGLGRRDELGQMARAVEEFKRRPLPKRSARRPNAKKGARIGRDAKSGAAEVRRSFRNRGRRDRCHVSSASTELEAGATMLTKTAETTEQLSTIVAGASEEASANVRAVRSRPRSELLGHRNRPPGARVEQDCWRGGQSGAEGDARIAKLSQAATRIGDVTKLITTIAEHTNLLALNATIEAARAGETGKGFAVVAERSRHWPVKTAKATYEISATSAKQQNPTRTRRSRSRRSVGSLLIFGDDPRRSPRHWRKKDAGNRGARPGCCQAGQGR